jgi:hypothetical protein
MAVHPSWRKTKAPAKAKSKTKAKAEPPDWLRKAMAVKPTKPKVGRKPDAIKAKFKAITAKARRKKMTISKDKPLPDPTLDPDFGAPAARFGDQKPSQLPAEEQIKIPEEQRTKGTKLAEEREVEPEPLFDEVAAGEEIPPENAQALIAGTLGGTGDHHADAKRILQRMADEANWVINKGADGTPAGLAIKARKEAQEKARKEAEERDRKDAKGKGYTMEADPKGADAGKGRGKNDPKGADDKK